MRILVTGSRDWTDVRTIFRAIDSVADQDGHNTVVHGAARGADTLAGDVARFLGFWVEGYPADWATHGKAAGVIRNQQMVDLGADVVLAFPIGESRGTRDCIRRAQAAGLRVQIHEGMPLQ